MKPSKAETGLHEARELVRELIRTLRIVASLPRWSRAEASLLDDAINLAKRAETKLADELDRRSRAGRWQIVFDIVERVASILMRVFLGDERLNYRSTASRAVA